MKIFVGTLLLALLACVPSAFAQTPQAPVAVEVSTQEKFSVETVKVWLAEAFVTTEIFRLKQAEYFTAMRETKKAELQIDVLPELGADSITDVAGTQPAPLPQKSGLQNPLEYGAYILSISLATLFTNKVIFYITSVLLSIILFRFIVSRLV